MRRVTKVAVKLGGKVFSLPVPASHEEVRVEHGLHGKGRAERGFLDNGGKFLSREEAARVALGAGQVTTGVKEVRETGKLHSHNLKG